MWGSKDRDDFLARLAARERRISELEHELATRSLEDPVTRLPSVAVFRARLADEVARSRRYHRPLALLVIEIDGLDDFLVARSAPAAEERLRMVALALRGLVRSADSVHRGAGGSFAVLLPETEVAGARIGADRIVRELEPVCPVSAGLACREERQSAESFEAAAAGAVSEARAAGGGRVVLACGRERRLGPDPGHQEAIEAVAVALLERDRYSGEHSEAVVDLAVVVARALGASHDAVADVRTAALLHDIGKVAIPDAILAKAGPLDEDEWEVMRQHPVIGERILRAAQGLGPVARIVRSEHECFDGSGYPDGIAGADIPLGSRIIFACHAYHAMTSERPYRGAMPVTAALAELARNAGTQFDPAVVEALHGWLSMRRQMSVLA